MRNNKSVIGMAVASALLAMSGGVQASGFALIEQSASGMGNAFAGGAAGAEDASTVFFNPAGMSRIDGNQVAVAAHAIKPSSKFKDGGSTGAALQTAGGNGGDAGDWAVVPNAYATTRINEALHFGIGVNAPFGLQTKYNSDWIGRFQAVKSKIETINVNPSLAYQVNDQLTLGLGLDYQHIKGKLTGMVNYSAAAFNAGGLPLLGAIGGAGVEGLSTVTGNDSAWGYNVGALFEFTPQTRAGLHYRSQIDYTLKGNVAFDNVPAQLAGALPNGAVTLNITMPESFSISGFHQLNEQWDVMADATRTNWSVFKDLKIDRTSGTNLTTVNENWKDTWRFALGANHHYNSQWTARAGVAYDQTPIRDAFRTARIPGNDRTWVTLGGQYKPASATAIDFAYAHIFLSDPSIAQDASATGGGNLVGSYKESVDIISVQLTQNF
ncbi:MAG: aromatic hydrocarbon degradation protein [Gallionellaceae bacterium CG11_big_fil_rev_8_21_14_0_20_60_62]|nr:MAG: aromatic hydrocarbon degradation protein [Gallionellaceae bacterium CG11_big_fil_rev_8_21_14_0_20_60_62]